ncbi:hypothetical protein C1701_16945 [Actinoalloteichus sp. AHMU CJ021]|uniref:SagB/ThcOx family dehydrogenase n=1 Tax=Actinoalloteichus sp. AHMU CJ021 TaxID=2072503 RepID=UPI000CA05186|nr:hypothetical protein C1701_16945 [Actinoalloteichus sp. AHMU CJ021]
MTHTVPDRDTTLHLPPNLSVRRSYDGRSGYQVTWGQGSKREHFQTHSAELAACLATMPSSLTIEEASSRLITELGLNRDAAVDLVSDLISYGYWSPTPQPLTAGEQLWRDVEWDDALEFHMATRNMIWSHDYSGNPKVMTRYHVEHNVQPESDPPTRYTPSVQATVVLPEPAVPDVAFEQVVRERRTTRDFRDTVITLQDLSTLLAWTFKPQFPVEKPQYYTTQSYSRGTPFTAYVITGGSGSPAELEQGFGVYHYDPEHHRLGLVRQADDLDQLDALLWRQSYVNHAPVMLVVCADWPQFSWKYRFSRAYRFVYAECGAFMHTALLVGTALGLKSFQTPAIDDRRMCHTLNVKDHEVGPIYIAAFGRGR